MFKGKLKPATGRKRREMLSKTVLLHMDNVRPRAPAAAMEKNATAAI